MSYKELYVSADPLVTIRQPGKPPIAKILGVPFDSTSSYRPGSRFGPNEIRKAFWNIEIYSHRLDLDLEILPFEDLGNLHHTADADLMTEHLGKVVSEIRQEGCPAALLGGEHSLTYAGFPSMPEDSCLVVFDAHLDLRQEYDDKKLGHATFLRRLVEKVGAERVLHVGARAASKEEWKFAEVAGLPIISGHIMESSDGTGRMVRQLLEDYRKVYISIDLDVLDPAFAPGVGNPEVAGLSTSQLLNMLYTMSDKEIVGFDIVELCPPYDNGATSSAAARFLAEILCLIYRFKSS